MEDRSKFKTMAGILELVQALQMNECKKRLFEIVTHLEKSKEYFPYREGFYISVVAWKESLEDLEQFDFYEFWSIDENMDTYNKLLEYIK